MAAMRRLQKELEDFQKQPNEQCSAGPATWRTDEVAGATPCGKGIFGLFPIDYAVEFGVIERTGW